MKKKLLKKKLTLSKETLRNLESSDLRDAVGGVSVYCSWVVGDCPSGLCTTKIDCPVTSNNTCGSIYC